MRQHIVSDAPLAILCSGGVDSSLLTALSSNLLPDVQAYVADAPGMGEGERAVRVGQHLGVPVRRIEIDRERFLRLWPYSVWYSDGPPLQQSNPALLAVTQAAQADGIKVMLAGEGSDEMFAGYSWQHSAYKKWQLASWLAQILPFESHRRKLRVLNQINLRNPNVGQAWTQSLERVMGNNPEDELFPRLLFERLRTLTPIADRVLHINCMWQLHVYLSYLLTRHDRMGMGASIETRVPFLENKLIDFALHLPRRAKFHRGVGKWVVKQSAGKRLPKEIVYASKKAFGMPSTYALGTENLLIDGLLAEHLDWSKEATRRIASDLNMIPEFRFIVVSLELWLRINFAGETIDELGERLVRSNGLRNMAS